MRMCERGHLFEDGEALGRLEHISECQGKPAYKATYICPHCGTDEHYEAETCLGCGTIFPTDDLDKGFCQKCGEELEYQTALDCSRIIGGYSEGQLERIKWGLGQNGSQFVDYLREVI